MLPIDDWVYKKKKNAIHIKNHINRQENGSILLSLDAKKLLTLNLLMKL